MVANHTTIGHSYYYHWSYYQTTFYYYHYHTTPENYHVGSKYHYDLLPLD